MLEARERAEWDRAALIVVHLSADKNKQLADFHPYLKRRPTGLSITPATIDRLKLLVDHR